MRSHGSSSATTSLPFEEQETAAAHWKQEVAYRVAERRARQQKAAHVVDARDPAQTHPAADAERAARAARIAAAVAARYSETPLFSEAVSALQSTAPAEMPAHTHPPSADTLAAAALAPMAAPTHEAPHPIEHDSGPHPAAARFEAPQAASDFLYSEPARIAAATEAIDFAQAAPVVEDVFANSMVMPQQPLPANLIPFPREIVAPRRARPRFAERSRADEESRSEPAAQIQLRIFEVDAPAAAEACAAPASDPSAVGLTGAIYLEAQSQASSDEEAATPALDLALPVAGIGSRAMAVAVDFTLVTGAFFAFLLVFALTSPQLPGGMLAGMISILVYGALWLLYQGMFFSLGYATAGMRYARIAFCTLEDSNPTRTLLLRRIPAWWVSALPLGLGFLWAAFDEDGLCWHDRMTGIYPRTY